MTSAGTIRNVLTAALCIGAASAHAQTVAGHMPGLLGRSPDQTLEVTISASGAYDDNLVSTINGTAADSTAPGGGAYQGVGTHVQYQKKFRRATFSLGENSLGRYYPSLAEPLVMQHSAVAAFSVQKNSTAFGVSQSTQSTPFYAYTSIPALQDAQLGDLPASGEDQSAALYRNLAYTSTASFRQGIGRRLELDASGTYQDWMFQHESNSLETIGGLGRARLRLLDSLWLVAGYGYQEGTHVTGGASTRSVIRSYNLGLDYNKTVASSNKTTFSFHTGTAAIEDSNGRTAYQLVGDAKVGHRLGRTWLASASYARNVGLIDGISVPTLSSAAALRVAGPLRRRATLALTGGYSRDQIGVAQTLNRSNTFTGSATATIALSQLVSMSAAYTIYDYKFANDVVLPFGLPPRFRRQEVQFGFGIWLPLVH